jgi:hypothetical protein
LILFFIMIFGNVFAQDKKALDHSVYEDWKTVGRNSISNDGNYTCYEINPQKGDGVLYLYDIQKKSFKSFERGNRARFADNSKLLVFSIYPQADSLRKMKLDKVKQDKLPKDSLGIYLIEKDSLIKIPNLKSFKLADNGHGWLAYLTHKSDPEKIESDTPDSLITREEKERIKKRNKKLSKQLNTHLYIINPLTGKEKIFKNVSDYSVSKNGELFVIQSVIKDSLDTTTIYVFNPIADKEKELFITTGDLKNYGIDEMGEQIAFVLSEDTSDHKIYDLYYGQVWKKKKPKSIITQNSDFMPDNCSVSEYSRISFSKDGTRIFFGTSEIPEQGPEDSLLAEEKYSVDVWNWQDKRLQTQQLKSLKADLKKNHQAVYLIDKKRMIQLADEDVEMVRTYNFGNGPYALGFSRMAYLKSYSWSGSRYYDAWLIDMKSGERQRILDKKESSIAISPGANYVYWYETKDQAWYIRSIKSGATKKLSAAIPHPIYQEVHDVPSNPHPYGIPAWTEDDAYVLVYDRYDIWKVDPEKP